MADEGVHEIQLNGKQLVFLFMAATVVSVVIFLCGVMVGRGVRPALAAAAVDSSRTPVDPTASIRSAPAPTTTDRQPVTTHEALTYAERLERAVPPPETLKDPAAATPAVDDARAPARPREAAAVTRSDPEPKAIEQASLAVPSGNGWVVQVGAYPRSTAEAIARGLAAKGFPSFIMPRDRGLFAVRVGKYSDRREADAVRLRLEQDEQFKNPWITR
jgi:cell division protein FtsN